MWGLNCVVNLALLSYTTIWNDSFGSVLNTIFSKSSRSIFYTLKYIVVWFSYIEVVQSSSILSAILFTAEINCYKTVRFFPDSFTLVSKFVAWHVAAYVVVVNVINIFQILSEQANEVCVFSYSLTRKSKIVLRYVKTIYVAVTTSGVIGFAFVLSFKQ